MRNGGRAAKQIASAVENANARRSEHLVTGECREVDTESTEVDRAVRHRLARIEYRDRTHRARKRDQFVNRSENTERVGDVGERDDSGSLADRREIHSERAIVGDGDVAQRRTGAEGEFLPGDQVGVVFRLGHNDLVARPDVELLGVGSAAPRRRVRETIRDEVDGLRGVRGPDDLVAVRTDKTSHALPGCLKQLRRGGGESVSATVHGRICLLVEVSLHIEHREWASATWRQSRGN